MDVKSADKKPEKYVGSDGKPRIRMVPVDKQVIKKESAVDEVSLSTIKKAVTSSGLKNVKKAQPTDKLKKDLEAMKLRLATEGTLSEATDMNKLKQLAAAGLVQKTDVQKLLRVFAKMESGKTVTPAEREMLLSVLSDLTSLITGDMSMLQKAKKAVKEEVELDEGITKMSHSRLKWHMNTGVPHGSYSKDEMKAERDRRLKTGEGEAYKKAKASMSEEAELDEGLGHISAIQNMMAKEREAQKKKKKYTAPTQAEIDADKKKERRASGTKKASMTFKDLRKKQYGNMMGGLKNEEVELDEAKRKGAPKMQGDWLKKEREKNREHDAAMGRTPTGRKKPVRQMTSTQRSLASMRKEEVELDEAEMSLYDKIKAARANPSPDKPVRGRGSKNRNPKAYDVRNTLDKEDDRIQAAVKKKLKKEEVELDEVLDTPKAMDSYKAKAKYSKERAANSAVAKMLRSKDKDNREHPAAELKTMAKRTAGLRMADKNATKKTFKKLRGEEVELDELSPNLLHRYVKKAAGNLAGNAAVAATQASSSMKKSSPDVKRKMINRMKGIAGASGRMADKANMAEEYVNEKLKVSHGMGAWVSDFQKSDAPQFKGKSDKERRDMAVAAYLSAKRGAKAEGYVSMAQQRAVWATRKDGGKGHPDNKGKK